MGNVVLSPALPAQLLAYILARCTYPTTLVVCSSATDFVQAVAAEEVAAEAEADGADTLLHDASSLLQVAVARHIRVAFVPTVVHLRAFLAAWDPADSRVAPPPEGSHAKRDSPMSSNKDHRNIGRSRPCLFVYGFLQVHRGTSEWSAQGLSSTAVLLDEAAHGTDMDAVVVDCPREGEPSGIDHDEHEKKGNTQERVPLLSTVPRRQLQKAGYPLRSQRVREVLSRWFAFAEGPWDEEHQPEDDAAGPETERSSLEEPPELPELPNKLPEQPVEHSAGKPPQTPGKAPSEAPRTFVKDSEDEDDGLSELGSP